MKYEIIGVTETSPDGQVTVNPIGPFTAQPGSSVDVEVISPCFNENSTKTYFNVVIWHDSNRNGARDLIEISPIKAGTQHISTTNSPWTTGAIPIPGNATLGDVVTFTFITVCGNDIYSIVTTVDILIV